MTDDKKCFLPLNFFMIIRNEASFKVITGYLHNEENEQTLVSYDLEQIKPPE